MEYKISKFNLFIFVVGMFMIATAAIFWFTVPDEDSGWVCIDGEWTAINEPDEPQPTQPCLQDTTNELEQAITNALQNVNVAPNMNTGTDADTNRNTVVNANNADSATDTASVCSSRAITAAEETPDTPLCESDSRCILIQAGGCGACGTARYSCVPAE